MNAPLRRDSVDALRGLIAEAARGLFLYVTAAHNCHPYAINHDYAECENPLPPNVIRLRPPTERPRR